MINYQEYIKSPKWQERRLAKLESAKYRCEECGEREGLSVHHKTYERLGNERSDDLIVLCTACHWVADMYRIGNVDIKEKFYTPIEKDIKQFEAEKVSRRKSHKKYRRSKPPKGLQAGA